MEHDDEVLAQAWMQAFSTYYGKHARTLGEYDAVGDWNADNDIHMEDAAQFADDAATMLMDRMNDLGGISAFLRKRRRQG